MAVTPRPIAPRIAVVGIVLSFVLAIAVGALRTVNAEPVERAAEVAGNAAFAMVFAVPAMLALLGLRGRPSLVLAAAILDLMLAVLTLISYIGLIFVAPAVMFFAAAGRIEGSGAGLPRSVAAAFVAILLGTAAFFVLFAREDPVCWATNPATGESVRLNPDRFVRGSSTSIESRDLPPGASESGCTSDSISTAEAIGAAAVVTALLGAAWVISTPADARSASAARVG